MQGISSMGPLAELGKSVIQDISVSAKIVFIHSIYFIFCFRETNDDFK